MNTISLFSRFKIYFNEDAYSFFKDVFSVINQTYGVDSMFLLDMDHDKCLHYGIDKTGYEIDDWMREYLDKFSKKDDIHYSLDCKNDPQFKSIYEKIGVRTSVFIPIRMEFRTKPVFQNREFLFDLKDMMHIGFKRANAMTETEMVLLALLVNQYTIRHSSFRELGSFVNLNSAIYEGIPFGLMTLGEDLKANINSAGRKMLGIAPKSGVVCTGMGMCYNCDRKRCAYRDIDLIDMRTIFEEKDLKDLKAAIDSALGTLELSGVKFWHSGRFLQFKIVPFVLRYEDLRMFYQGKKNSSLVSVIISFEDLTETVENQNMKNELEIARKIQMELLPKRNLSIETLEIKAAYVPSMVVGGDYYDIVDLGKGKFGVVIGDVSGKGVSAAFFMAELKGVINAAFTFQNEIEDVGIFINGYLRKTKKRGFFVTMVIGVLDTRAGYFDWIRFGHEEPLRYSSTTGRADFLPSEGVGFNLLDASGFEKVFKKRRIWLEAGDVLLFYTDGVTERTNPEGELYGNQRIMDIFEKDASGDASTIVKHLLEDVAAFGKGNERFDDITILAVKYLRKAD